MSGPRRFASRQQALMFDLMAALNSSLDLSEVLPRAYGVLSQVLAADYAALCVSRPGQSTEYDWLVAEMKPEYFARYPEMAAEDFVREAVAKQPNRVLRDTEMVPREKLERSLLYQRSRELGMPLEHVMAVLLDMRSDWHGGLMLYRERPRPFSDEERAFLQQLTPILASTVRNCRLMSAAADERQILEGLVRHQGVEILVLSPPGKEVMRTAQVSMLLERWFTALERGAHGLPVALVERLALLTAGGPAVPGLDCWERAGARQSLRVTFVPLPEQGGRRLWGLVFEERDHAQAVPQAWLELLTQREVEVVERVLRGWDNQTIAQDLGCSVATVKKHLQRIFDKHGVDSRAALMILATRSRGVPP